MFKKIYITGAAAIMLQPPLWAQSPSGVSGLEFSGKFAAEVTSFSQPGMAPVQDYRVDTSLSAELAITRSWQNGKRQWRFTGYARGDERDSQRTHGDIRELYYLQAGGSWELRAGIRKVFWGVTESRHLVDIINQTDLVENIDAEEKLGQPMINLALIRSWGTVDLFVLPGFRERTFPGADGRLRAPLPVWVDNPAYESTQEDRHVDAAVRWSHSLGDWDMGVAYFRGTSRDPLFQVAATGAGPVLRPFYEQISQASLDVQATKGAWLWKLETIHRESDRDTYTAATGGFEFTFYDVAGKGFDVGLVTEYLYDDRHDRADTPFQDDLMTGVRLALNDTQSTEALLAVIADMDGDGELYTLEGSRRLSSHWKVSVQAGVFRGFGTSALLFGLLDDDFLQVELAYYF